ncbi:MAG: beta-propeller fold lactonase family protein [Planctomycetota bacterium]|nr:beta-propeller fold lactonase family protein [Planctomycetota bacterium]
MIIPRISVIVVAMLLLGTAHSEATERLYLSSTDDKALIAYKIDAKTGALKKEFSVALGGRGGPLAFSPDKKFIYAALFAVPKLGNVVVTLRRRKGKPPKIVKSAKIAARTCYIRPDKSGRFLLAAHYGTGEVTIYKIDKGLCTNEMVDREKTEKTAHSVEFDRSGRFAYVPHTRPNKVYQFHFDAKTGQLTAGTKPFAQGPDLSHNYHQPRHFLPHPTLDLGFTSNEKGGGLSAWKMDGKDGSLSLVQTLSTLAKNHEGKSAAADLKISPNGRFVYVSNRDLAPLKPGTLGKDSIAAFSIDPTTGALKAQGRCSAGRFPRSFCINTDGLFLYAACQKSHDIYAYKINQESGQITFMKKYKTGKTPIWVMTASRP